jgi:hypothetical protein
MLLAASDAPAAVERVNKVKILPGLSFVSHPTIRRYIVQIRRDETVVREPYADPLKC